jgi:hypothetical protein
MGLLNRKKKETPVETLDSVEQANKEQGEVTGGQGHVISENPKRKKGETQQAYNERVPVALQPVAAGPTHSYLGNKL